MVFQKPNPFPAMSIADNVAAGLALTGTKISRGDRNELVERCLSRAGLLERGQGPARQARAPRSPVGSSSGCASPAPSPSSPKVLLMDEPCSALDPTSTRRIEETIAELRSQVTIVIVTHNMQTGGPSVPAGGVLPGGAGNSGRDRRERPDPDDLFATRRTRAPPTTWTGGSDDVVDAPPGRRQRRMPRQLSTELEPLRSDLPRRAPGPSACSCWRSPAPSGSSSATSRSRPCTTTGCTSSPRRSGSPSSTRSASPPSWSGRSRSLWSPWS